MVFDIVKHNGTIRGMKSNGKYAIPDHRTLTPYPSDIIYNKGVPYDGIIYYYPVYERSAYFGGGSADVIVPHILEYGNGKFKMNLLTGAPLNVYLHEIFHGFESKYKIGDAHVFSKDNSAKWPSWYRDAVSSNGGETAEWLYYKGMFAGKIAGGQDIELLSAAIRIPAAEVFESAVRYAGTKSQSDLIRVSELILKADALSGKGKLREAETVYKSAIKIMPDHPVLLYKTGLFYQWRIKDMKTAIQYYEAYLGRYTGYPGTFDCALYSSLHYLNTGEPDRVLSVVASASKYLRGANETYHMLHYKASALLRKGQTSDAIKILGQGISASDNPIRSRFEEALNKIR